VLSTLLERNFITVRRRDERPGRPLLYETTKEFLRYFGFNDLSELPKIEELEKILKDGGEKKYSEERGDENLS